MRLSEYLDVYELAHMIEAGRIREAKHESLPLTLYTYTERAQFAEEWTDSERKCRGLVVEDTGEIVAWSMKKFFNYSEHANGKSYAAPLPAEEFEVFSKMDGSMGTVFFYDDSWHVASKGSFHSEQAQWATSYVRQKVDFGDFLVPRCDALDKFTTYVCEIIYPTNRIVVDYGSLEDLVLLTAYAVEDGAEWAGDGLERRKLEWGWVGSVVPWHDPCGISVGDLQTLADENILIGDEDQWTNNDREVSGTDSEGYVVRFKKSGIRCKIKLNDYLRLHKVLTNCTERSIWEVLSTGGSLDGFLENVPDEFREWVNETAQRLKEDYEFLLDDSYLEFVDVLYTSVPNFDLGQLGADLRSSIDRKKFAAEAMREGKLYPSACFLHLDGKSSKLSEWAWKKIRPSAAKPFTGDADV
jgi:RNA ligase